MQINLKLASSVAHTSVVGTVNQAIAWSESPLHIKISSTVGGQ